MVTAAGVALVGLGYAISTAGAVLGGLAAVISGIGSAIGILGSILAWLLTPMGLVTAAIAALGAYLLYSTQIGGQALTWLGQRFTELSAFARESFQGIADAILAGDIALAAQILWLSLKVLWQKGVLELTRLWESLKSGAMKIVYGLWHGVQAAWEIGMASIAGLMLELYYGVLDVWQACALSRS